MSGPLYGNGRRDSAEPGVVEALEQGGATVTKLSGKGIPDLLVGFGGRNHLVEVKTGKAGLRDTQVRFGSTWRGEAPVIARTAPQARKLLRLWRDSLPTVGTVLRANLEASGGTWAAIEDDEEEQAEAVRRGP